MGPTSRDEYMIRFTANQKLSGFGMETATHFPCPFCAADDWLIAKVLEFEDVGKVAHTCAECGRSGRFIFDRNANGVSFEFVQTGGDDPAAWLHPAPRREVPPPAPLPVDRTAITTLRGTPVDVLRQQHAAQSTGQHADYIVLTEAELKKGFVRPVRSAYKHVGTPAPKTTLRPLSPEELERYAKYSYVAFEAYPENDSSTVGRYWTQEQIDRIGNGCGTVTTMGAKLAETYARDPGFYGATMCVGCNKHLPVGEHGEFVWVDGSGARVGT